MPKPERTQTESILKVLGLNPQNLSQKKSESRNQQIGITGSIPHLKKNFKAYTTRNIKKI